MADPYAEIRKLAEDETCLISAASYSTLRRFVLAALPVMEAADHAVSVLGLEDSIDQLSRALANLEEVTRG